MGAEYGIINATLINRSTPRMPRWVEPQYSPECPSLAGWSALLVEHGARVAPCQSPSTTHQQAPATSS